VLIYFRDLCWFFFIKDDLKEMLSRIDVPEVTPRLLTPEEREQLRERNNEELELLRQRREKVDECVSNCITHKKNEKVLEKNIEDK
jgi:hypothetical protein